MTWSAEFRALLAARTQRWRIRVRALTWYDTALTQGVKTQYWEAKNYRRTAGDEGYLIDLGPIQGSTIAPPDFGTSWGTFSFSLATPLLSGNRITRGQLCMVEAGGEDWPESQFEPIAIGQVWNIRGDAHSVTVECRDVFAALATRITQSLTDSRLFSELGVTTLASGYNPADATMRLTSVAGFERETGGAGLVQVEDNSGNLYFVTFTGISGTDLTGLTPGVLDTTAANAGAGKTVRCVAYIPDHPIRVALKLLTSTGTGTNGPYDTLPDSWGYAIPQAMVDVFASDRHRFLSAPTTGSDAWEAYSIEPQDDGIAWIRDGLQIGGWVLCIRQGRIAVRAVPDLTGGPLGSPYAYFTAASLANPDIVEGSLPEVEWYDQGYDHESRQVTIKTVSTTGTRAEVLETLPAELEHVIDASAYLHDNEAAWIVSLGRRLAPWHLRVPERITLETSCGLAASVAAGDVVELTTDRYAGRFWPLAERRCLVLGSTWSLTTGTGSLTLALLPTDLEVGLTPVVEGP